MSLRASIIAALPCLSMMPCPQIHLHAALPCLFMLPCPFIFTSITSMLFSHTNYHALPCLCHDKLSSYVPIWASCSHPKAILPVGDCVDTKYLILKIS